MSGKSVQGSVWAALAAGLAFFLMGLWRPGGPSGGPEGGAGSPSELPGLKKRAEAAEQAIADRPLAPLQTGDAFAGHRVFISPLLLFFPDQPNEPVQALDPALKTADGILVKWKLQHGLDVENAQVAGQDEDNDGFTNREEFEGGTDPVNPQSTPAKWIKLRLQSFEGADLLVAFVAKAPDRISLRFRAGAKVEDVNLAPGDSFWVGVLPQQIKIWKEEAGAQAAARQGIYPHPLPLRLKEYREDIGERFEPKTKTMNPYNDSHVILERKDALGGEYKILINDATRSQGGVNLPMGLVRLVPLVPGESALGPFQPGQTFTYAGDAYVLLEASAQQAKIRLSSAQQDILVLPATP